MRRRSRRFASCALGVALVVSICLAGCQTTAPKEVVTRPAQHSIQSEQLVILSDFKLPKDHPLIVDLIDLRKFVSQDLELPLEGDEVVVYLFENELIYRQFLNATYPGLPPRRAYFVGSENELAVYTFWGERIQEDLRHEYTHGLLHAAIKEVPLWLDEGLAEYYEVAGPTPGEINMEFTQHLSTAMGNGWKPGLERLEGIKDFSQMQRLDYAESWGWMHYMLKSSPEGKAALLAYLHDLRSGADAIPLSDRLKNSKVDLPTALTSYLTSLTPKPNAQASNL